jgi:hypothetical protein
MKLVFMLLAALLRDALVVSAGAERLRVLPANDSVVALAQAGLDGLEARLGCLKEAEWMLDRNVAAKLVSERVGVGLLGD